LNLSRCVLPMVLATSCGAVSGCGAGGSGGDASARRDEAKSSVSAFEVRTYYDADGPCRMSGPENAMYYLQSDSQRAWIDLEGDGSTDAIREEGDLCIRNSLDPEVPWIHVHLGDHHVEAFASFTEPGLEVGAPMFTEALVDPLADAQRLADAGVTSPEPLDPSAPDVATVQWWVDADGRVTKSQIETDPNAPGGGVRSTVSSASGDSVRPPDVPTGAQDLLDLPASSYAPTSLLVDPSCAGGDAEQAAAGKRCLREATKGLTIRDWLDKRSGTASLDGSGC
jgi:hypothetical protein